MKFYRICYVDGAVGCAVVDLNSGLLLASAHNVPYFTSSYLEAVAAAAVNMFRGKTVRAVESLLSTQRGVPVQHAIKEIQMATDKTYHFMATLQNKPDSLVVLVTTRDANLGIIPPQNTRHNFKKNYSIHLSSRSIHYSVCLAEVMLNII